MERRLVKVAKELNVGVSTMVDFLQGKGFDIDNKPTAKVSDDMYQELLKEFQKSIAIKEKADQLVIGTRPSAPAPGTSAPKHEEPAPEPKVEKAKPEEPAKPEPEPEEPRKAAPRLKVLGKIDLSRGRGAKPAKEEEEAPKEQATPTPEKEAPEKPAAETPAPAPEKEPEKEQPVAEQPAAEPTPAPEPAKEPAPKEEAKPEPEAAKPVVEEKPEAGQPAEPQEAKAEQSEAGQADKPEKKEEEKPAVAAEDSGMVRAKTPELRGLKILGKIDTSKLERSSRSKKDSSKDDKDKDKDKDKGAANEPRKRRKRTRKKITAREASGGGGRDGGKGRRGKKEETPSEVSQREIEEKIKATMARISGTGKKRRQRQRRDNRERIRERQEALDQAGQTDKLQVTEFISVQELANLMEVDATDVIMTCMNIGVIVSINQRLDAEVIELVAEEYGHEVEFISVNEEEEEDIIEEDDPEDLQPRAPVVTIMGHVDHGKTSLLDHIRKANVAEGEAGGITQHIGAYEVNVGGDDNKKITFLDTPGHEAFTAMRARGAKVTDVAIIIIAADDNVMPQTKEAISHAQAAGVPIIFAINKIDKPGANPDRIKQELSSMNLLIEEWGGEYQSQDISAKTGIGIDELLDKILLQAEMLELKANPDREASGTILEASLDKGRGYVAKMLVQNGTLEIGDSMVSGEHSGRVKAMFNERNKRVKEAGPSTPVLVLGLGGAPQAGERFRVVESEQEARGIANRRAQISREQANRATKRISLDEIGRRLALGNFKELNLIVKGDVDGSVEALSDSLIKLSQETVQVNVIHRAVGQIIESDVLLASASDAIIIGFQVRPSGGARKLAEREGVQIKTYSIIYEAIEEIKAAIEGMLDTIKEEKVMGQIEVREIFKISKVGTVAGCYVTEGKVLRDSNIRLIRDGIVIYPTREGQVAEINALKRFKDDVKEVRAGMECGISIKNFNDIKAGDIIEAFEIIEIKQKLE
ncbi:MAG: translation initiation factor IF-2 [Lewinella sp.]|nr:translation initiation factor IF-2 [Lewinella sp.]